jgi:hypothetical protein
MIHDCRNHRSVIAVGISIGLLSGCGHAWAGEAKTTKPVVQLHAQLQGKPPSSTPDKAKPGNASSGFVQDLKRGIVHGFTSVFEGWTNSLKADLSALAASASAANVQKVTLGENVVLKKIASEEHTLIEGTTVQPSRSTTLPQGVSLSRAAESLGEAGIDLKAVKAEIGARVSEMLGDELREATGTLVTIDGNVWERARIDWYAKIRAGKVILEANGITHELPFEYTVGFEQKVAGTPRRRPGGPRSNGDAAAPSSTFEASIGRVTVVSAQSPDLFEARFETTPAVVQGDKLPVFRGGMNAKCVGYCQVVAVRGPRIVGRCEGFRPKVGDSVGRLEVAHRLDRTR